MKWWSEKVCLTLAMKRISRHLENVGFPRITQLFSGLILWLKGHRHIDLRPFPRFRMNLELPIHQACTFSHASDAQAHAIPHLLRMKSAPFVTHREK